jgi:hypothetical protein
MMYQRGGLWSSRARRPNKARLALEKRRRERIANQRETDVSGGMQLFRKEVPVYKVASSITRGYTDAANRMRDLYANRGENISNIYKTQTEQARADLQPWRQAGERALQKLESKIDAGPGDFETSPGYQFRLEQGQRALDSSAAARGGALSGRAIKEAMRYNQGFASNEYQNFVNRYYQSLQPLQQLSDSGQQAATQQGQFSMQAAPGIARGYEYGTEGAAKALMFGAQGIERGQMSKLNALTSAYSAALQAQENERNRPEQRETELRAYEEANRLREAAAYEKLRRAQNRAKAYGLLTPNVSSQLPYY